MSETYDLSAMSKSELIDVLLEVDPDFLDAWDFSVSELIELIEERI